MIRRGAAAICLVALIAIAGLSAAGASAAEYEMRSLPEFGRCVRATGKTGEYNRKNCIAHKATGGKFNFQPGPGAKKKFTGSGKTIVLETPGNTRIACAGAEESGEYVSPKTETVSVTLTGCHDQTSQTCQSNPLKPGEIATTQSLEGEIGFIKGGSKPSVGLDLKAKAPASALFTFECGKAPESVLIVTVEGSVIGPITKLDRLVEKFKTVYQESAGKQAVQQFEGGSKDTLTVSVTSGVTTTKEEAALGGTFEATNEEALEIKAKESFH